MSEIITARDIDIVTTEINTIKTQTQRMLLVSAIEIGRRLVEAKEMVPHGEWGKYLEDKVDYSQSTANNLMKIYNEYGGNQESLFDNFSKSQAFEKLSYTQALALLAVPAEDRERFAEENHVEDMSTRELQEAIRERDAALKAQQEAENALDDKSDELEKANRRADQQYERAQEEKSKADELRNMLKSAESESAVADQKVKDLEKKVQKLQKDVNAAAVAEETARAKLRKAQENPQIPESMMEQLRQEAAANAASEATAQLQKQLQKAQDETKAALKAKEAAENAVQDVNQKLEDIQKQSKMANPDIVVFKTIYEQVQEAFNRLAGLYMKVKQTNPEAANSLKKAMGALLDAFQSQIKGVDAE